ncbi:MAG: PLP-dependent transferase, partial [Saprospiraceae bacterium]
MNRKAIKHFATLCAKGVNDPKTTKPHQLPIYATAGFEFETSIESINSFQHQPGTHVYSRYGNPTVEAVAQKIADLEAFGTGKEAYGLLTSSGQSAVHLVIQSLLKPGDVIITQGNLYGGTT